MNSTAASLAAAEGISVGTHVRIKAGRLGAGYAFTVTTLTGIGAQALRHAGDVYVGDSNGGARLSDVEVAR